MIVAVELVAKHELTEKQAALVDALTEGASVSEAARISGYSNTSSALTSLKSKTVALYLQQRLASRLSHGAPAMFSVLEQIAHNKALPAGPRVDAAKAWLDRAGWTVPRQEAKSSSEGKGLAEMTAEELRRTVLELKAEHAKDVTPSDPDGLFD